MRTFRRCSPLLRRPLRAALFSDNARLRDPRPARAHVLLGVAANAPLDDIKDAYWRLAKRTHPDSNRGDEDAATLFTRLTRAYEAMTKHAKSGGTSGSVDVVRVSEAPARSQRKAVSHAKAIFLDVSGDMERLGNALNNEFDRELAEAVADCAGTLNAGELVISLDTARRQAREINDAAAAAAHASSAAASLAETERDVLRILLTHGALHLLGFTHDDLLDGKRSLSYATAMGRAEDAVMKHLGWKGQGLVFAHFA